MTTDNTSGAIDLSSLQKGVHNFVNNFANIIRNSFKITPEVAEAIRAAWKAFEHWPEYVKEYWIQAAEMGWYFNWETPASSCIEATIQGKTVLDSFMISHLEHDWGVLTKKIINLCPERKSILNEAFLLHEEGRYIASIPLLFSQIDGICAQYLGAFLFSEHPKRAESIENELGKNQGKTLEVFLELIKIRNPHSKGIGKKSQKHKDNGVNRNGVLHGSRKHLDYGTKINSLKCFSLLAYIVFILVDQEK